MAIQRIENVKLDKLIISWVQQCGEERRKVEERKVEEKSREKKSMVEALNALKL